MPGRRGKQRVKRKKSKRQKPSEMERVLVDSIHGRRRKERQILKNHIPPPVKLRTNKVALATTLPMFNAMPVKNDETGATAAAAAPADKPAKAKKASSCQM
ncbi:hypothetical protein DQ04_01881070 [Trypanosoma grayi]|uniref:hypothetical protein n=1 Tax=Trypanosoma grayi TaxID=71804 RepID=UPI0004F42DCB|nr:hypothetical protein DQ04_01881070 [Trypanosoma grayi]KEG12223.1 hypothetical protein DQ04_01881070 [Trypanosoma grayi]